VELKRLSEMRAAFVVVEAGWHTILTAPPERSRLLPKTVFRSVIAWQQRYPRVHWWMMEGRRLGEVATLRILQRYWQERKYQERKSDKGVLPIGETRRMNEA
jgi:hypothetical protein